MLGRRRDLIQSFFLQHKAKRFVAAGRGHLVGAGQLLALQLLLGGLTRCEGCTAVGGHGLGCWRWLVGTVHHLGAAFLSHAFGTGHHTAGGRVVKGHAGRCRISDIGQRHHGRDVAHAQLGAPLAFSLQLLTLGGGCVAASYCLGPGLSTHAAVLAGQHAPGWALVERQQGSGLVLRRCSPSGRVQACSGCHVVAASGSVGDHRHGDTFSSSRTAQRVGAVQRHGFAWLEVCSKSQLCDAGLIGIDRGGRRGWGREVDGVVIARRVGILQFEPRVGHRARGTRTLQLVGRESGVQHLGSRIPLRRRPGLVLGGLEQALIFGAVLRRDCLLNHGRVGGHWRQTISGVEVLHHPPALHVLGPQIHGRRRGAADQLLQASVTHGAYTSGQRLVVQVRQIQASFAPLFFWQPGNRSLQRGALLLR